MKVRDLLPMDVDIDVYDDVCEELAIAFCGPMKLTAEGERKFADVMDYEMKLVDYGFGVEATVCVNDDNDRVWRERLAKAKEFFESAAGYCAEEDYDKWFDMEDENDDD